MALHGRWLAPPHGSTLQTLTPCTPQTLPGRALLRGLTEPHPTCLPEETERRGGLSGAMTQVLKVLWGCRKGQPVLPGNLRGSWEAGWWS